MSMFAVGKTLFSLALVFVILSHGMPASAQLALPGGTIVSISSAPEYPGPNTAVRLKLQSVLVDLFASDITWFVNDSRMAEGVGMTEMTVTTGALGTETQVRAEVRGETSAVASGVLRPTELDLLWEADSYVPPFYRGRALPSPGSNVRLFAVPRFQRAGSASFVSPDELIYTWRKNNKVLQSVSGRGRYSVTTGSPVLFGTDTISVEARTSDGMLRGAASVRIASVEPTLSLYQNHPVFGILYHRALRTEDSISEVEAVFTAIPYYAPARIPANGLLSYEWTINGAPIVNDPSTPNSITINAEGSTGLAQIALALTHATNFFLSAAGSWNITLSAAEDAVFSDPFRGNE